MTPLRHIAVITGNYPSRAHPNRGPFVRQLVHAFAELGVRCTVIHPWKVHEWLRERGQGCFDEGDAVEGVRVYRPLTFSTSNYRLGPFNTFALTQADFQRAVWRVLRSLPEKPDAVYGHFLYSAGATAVWAGQRLDRPGFVAVGESFTSGGQRLWTLQQVRLNLAKGVFARAAGFVAVSDLLRRELILDLGIPETKIRVFSNGIQLRQFYPRDRKAMRSKYALPDERFLVAFVGEFDERKGVRRVSTALEGLPRVGGIFIGDGPLRPSGDQVFFCGRVPHQQVPELLCAADVFVLPSRAEGCSNATLEAMACRLPVVVSARPFNADICDNECARLVEPDDVQAIRNAIVTLQNNPDLRRHLADAAFARAAHFDIQARARNILDWMEEKISAGRSIEHPVVHVAPCGQPVGSSGVPRGPMGTRLRHIAVITGNYPSRAHPNRGPFVRQLVHAFAELGVRCTVIHPWKVHEWLRERGQGCFDEGDAVEGVRVYRPLTFSMSNYRLGPFNTFALTQADFQRAVWRVLRSLPEKPDAVYGHFLYSAGATAVWAGQLLDRPSFVAVGEGTFWTLKPLGLKRARWDLTPMTGTVAVSSLLRRRLIEELDFPPNKVKVFPNGVDLRKFHPRDRSALRRKHGLPADRFLVIFVGNFIEPKGVHRVAAAIDGLPGVSGVFVGMGPAAPKIKNLAFCGKVPHNIVPELLSAADCFVLPSDAEGSSNATLEAMACGLPVVVSARPFNADICDNDCARLVEPDDVQAIRNAIVTLQNNSDLRRRLADAALARATHFNIQARARRILDWMDEKVRARQLVASGSTLPLDAGASLATL